MRNRAEILDDATRTTEKGVLVPEFDNKLQLLTLEVLIDIRNVLNNQLKRVDTVETRFIRTH